jgi:putative cyclase
LTRDRVIAAGKEIQKGAVFPMNLDMALPSPPLGGRTPSRHSIVPIFGGLGQDGFYDNLNTQASSQIDGFAHARNPRFGFYNGLASEEHSVHYWAEHGIVGRGVVVDLEAWRVSEGRPLIQGTADPIGADEVLAALEAQGSEFVPGDILLLYTGFLTWYRTLDESARVDYAEVSPTPGLATGVDMARTLWNLHPSLVASDDLAVEVYPPTNVEVLFALGDDDEPADIFLHTVVIPLLGIPLGEMWDLDELVQDCRADGRYSCLVTAAVMNQRGGVATMANAVATK